MESSGHWLLTPPSVPDVSLLYVADNGNRMAAILVGLQHNENVHQAMQQCTQQSPNIFTRVPLVVSRHPRQVRSQGYHSYGKRAQKSEE